MGYEAQIFPEIWLSLIAAIVFFPMMFLLNQRGNFDLWRFSILFTLIVAVVYFYAFWDMKKGFKLKPRNR
ncbi:hypothetical protein JXL21_06085 [Candidatus Bathyarchaeota archaeon]|nr:hypothetical protein [Candidatus Bathyarchaeota archaeon]